MNSTILVIGGGKFVNSHKTATIYMTGKNSCLNSHNIKPFKLFQKRGDRMFMCEFTQGIRGSYQNAGVMCLVVTYKYILQLIKKYMSARRIELLLYSYSVHV